MSGEPITSSLSRCWKTNLWRHFKPDISIHASSESLCNSPCSADIENDLVYSCVRGDLFFRSPPGCPHMQGGMGVLDPCAQRALASNGTRGVYETDQNSEFSVSFHARAVHRRKGKNENTWPRTFGPRYPKAWARPYIHRTFMFFLFRTIGKLIFSRKTKSPRILCARTPESGALVVDRFCNHLLLQSGNRRDPFMCREQLDVVVVLVISSSSSSFSSSFSSSSLSSSSSSSLYYSDNSFDHHHCHIPCPFKQFFQAILVSQRMFADASGLRGFSGSSASASIAAPSDMKVCTCTLHVTSDACTLTSCLMNWAGPFSWPATTSTAAAAQLGTVTSTYRHLQRTTSSFSPEFKVQGFSGWSLLGVSDCALQKALWFILIL